MPGISGVGLWEMTLVLLVLVNLAAEGARRHKKPPVWLNPCKANDYWRGKNRGHDSSVRSQLQVTGRGQRASPKPLRRLRMQVTITWNHLSSYTPSLSKIICNRVSSLGTIFSYNWLPRNQSQWYRRHVKCLDKTSKVLILLPKFQEGLQRYAASFEKLRSAKNLPALSVLTPDCRYFRQKVIDELAAKLNQLLCEVDKTMSDLKIRHGDWLDEEEANSFMPDYGKDLTTAQLYDWGVLTSYDSYISDWKKIVRQVVGPKGDARCSPTHRNKLQLPLN